MVPSHSKLDFKNKRLSDRRISLSTMVVRNKVASSFHLYLRKICEDPGNLCFVSLLILRSIRYRDQYYLYYNSYAEEVESDAGQDSALLNNQDICQKMSAVFK